MRSVRSLLAATALMATATACSQEAEAPANETAAAETTDPYAAAGMQMMERMAGAQGANPSLTWVRKMIEHHRGAIAMSEILEAQGGDPQVLNKARMTAQKQRREIAELEALLPERASTAPASSQSENPYARAVAAMHEQMMAASGANPSETWLSKMIAHHRGGVAMSNVLLELGGDPRIVARAGMTARNQAREADELERMLSGEAAPATASQAPADAPPAPAASRPKAGRTVTPPAAPKAKAQSPAPAETPAEDPHAGHDMSDMTE